MIEVHACTPYNPTLIKNYKNELLHLMIKIEHIWEMLLTKLRGTIIAYAAKIKIKRTQKESKLVRELEDLDHLFLLNIKDKTLEQKII